MKPLCVAPWTSVLVNTDKGVMPCAIYSALGFHVPNNTGVARLVEGGPTIKQIMAGPAWQEICQDLANHRVPPGCENCVQRVRRYGFGTIDYYEDPDWDKGITHLEINTTNLCTLQCRMCSPLFSHKWAKVRGGAIHRPNRELLMRSLEELDWTWLRRVMFKGGEPMINPDVPAVLAYLDSIGRLEQVTVTLITNATLVGDELLDLLARAKGVDAVLSVDGVGELLSYIRHGGATIERIERTVARLASLSNIEFFLHPCVLPYNVFRLDQLHRWWLGLAEKTPAKFCPLTYSSIVVDPLHLSIHVLQDETRAALLERYAALDPQVYGMVVRALELPYAGDELHDRFVQTTRETDRLLGVRVDDIVPELAPEMMLSTTRVALERAQAEFESGRTEEAIRAAEDTLRLVVDDAQESRPVLDFLSEHYASCDRIADGLALVERALEHAPDDPDVLVRRGFLWTHAGKTREARQLADDLSGRWPDHARDLRRLIDEVAG